MNNLKLLVTLQLITAAANASPDAGTTSSGEGIITDTSVTTSPLYDTMNTTVTATGDNPPKTGNCKDDKCHIDRCRNFVQKHIYENPKLRIAPMPRSNVINVTLTYAFLGVQEVDTVNSRVKITMYWEMYWRDYQLAWDLKECARNFIVVYPATLVWFPYWTIQNSYTDMYSVDRYQDLPLYVYNAGVGFLSFQTEQEIKCRMDLGNFPHEEHSCQYVIWFMDSIEVTARPLQDRDKYGPPTGTTSWEVRNSSHRQDDRSDWTTIEFVIKRRPTFVIFTMIVPVMILCPLPILPFLLPPDSGEKMSVAQAALLTYFVMSLGFFDDVPVSDDFPKMGLGFLYLMGTTALATFICAAILRRSETEKKRPQPHLNRQFSTLIQLMQRQRPDNGGTVYEVEEDTPFQSEEHFSTNGYGSCQRNEVVDSDSVERARRWITANRMNNVALIIFTISNLVLPIIGFSKLIVSGG